MKKEKKIDESNISSSSSMSVNESIVEFDDRKKGALRVESKLIEKTYLIDKNNNSNAATNKSKAAIKPIKSALYILSCLFLFQLALTTIGFYLQFNYLKTQTDLYEIKIANFFDRVINDLNIDFNELLRQQISRKKDPTYSRSDDDNNYMILNLTHEIDLNDLNVDELNKTVLTYQQNLFDAVLKENLNGRIKRNTKRSSSFYHKVNYSQQGNTRNHRHQGDTFFLTDKQPKNVSGDHFLIQAYSKISVGYLHFQLISIDIYIRTYISLRYLRWLNIVQQQEITVHHLHQARLVHLVSRVQKVTLDLKETKVIRDHQDLK